MEVSLVMFKADGQRKEFPLHKSVVTLGRKHTCDLRIPIPSVSREHCRLEVDDEAVVIRDLGSSNGTAVNDEPIQEARLSPGDKITIGPVHFVVTVDGEPADIHPVKTIISPPASVQSADESRAGAQALAASDSAAGIEIEEEASSEVEADEVALSIEDDGEQFADASDEPAELAAPDQDEIDIEALTLEDENQGQDEAAEVAVEEEPTEELSEDDSVIALEEDSVDEEPIALDEEVSDDQVVAMDEEQADAEEPELSLDDEEPQAISLEDDSAIVVADDGVEGEALAAEEEEEPAVASRTHESEEDDPFADLAIDALSDNGDEAPDLAELAEAFGDEEEDEK
jgi:pSer/pThr/pTyr-binding forkhead associated (FHA) protein